MLLHSVEQMGLKLSAPTPQLPTKPAQAVRTDVAVDTASTAVGCVDVAAKVAVL